MSATMHDPELVTESQARAALIACGLALNRRGLNHGKAGNASVRWHRGGRDGLLVTPSALPYDRMSIEDIVWLSLDAEPSGGADGPMPAVVDAQGRVPSSEWRLHRDLYVARDEVAAVVHAHPPHASALACVPAIQAGGIPPFHYMVAAAGGRDIRCAAYATFGTQALSDAVIAAMHGRRACLMAHHGILAVGAGLAAALALAEEVEALARGYHLARLHGGPALLDDAEMGRVLERFASYRP